MKLAIMIFIAFTSLCSAQDKKPYTVYLKPGAIITHLKTKKTLATDKGVYVKVLESNYQKRDIFTIFDKKGIPQYETTSESLVEFDNDVRLLPVHRADVIYPPQSPLKLADKNIWLDSSFNIHLDNIQTSEFNSIYSDNLESVVATRFELKTVYGHLDFPIKIGASINYQGASWRNDFDQVNLSILSFGPLFTYDFYTDDTLKISALLGAEFAPVYKTSSGDSQEDYKAMIYDLGVESVWSTEFGFWSVGSHIRKHNISLIKTSRPDVNPVLNEITLTSLGLMIGYKYEWDL